MRKREKLVALSVSLLAFLYGGRLEMIAEEKITKKDFFMSKSETMTFWSDFYKAANPVAKYLVKHRSLIDTDSDLFYECFDYIYFFLNKTDFLQCNLQSIWSPMFGNLPYFLYHAKTSDSQVKKKLQELYGIIDSYDNKINEINRKAQLADKKYGLFEQFLLN